MEKKNNSVAGRLWVKVIAFIVLIAMGIIAATSLAIGLIKTDETFIGYKAEGNAYHQIIKNEAARVMWGLRQSNEGKFYGGKVDQENNSNLTHTSRNMEYQIFEAGNKTPLVYTIKDAPTEGCTKLNFKSEEFFDTNVPNETLTQKVIGQDDSDAKADNKADDKDKTKAKAETVKVKNLIIKTYTNDAMPYADDMALKVKVSESVNNYGDIAWIAFGLSMIAGIGIFVFLIYAAGRKYGHEGYYEGGLAKFPLDLQLVLLVIVAIMLLGIATELGYFRNWHLLAAYGVASFAAGVTLTMGFIMNLASGIKMKYWLKNSVCGRIFGLAGKGAKSALDATRSMGKPAHSSLKSQGDFGKAFAFILLVLGIDAILFVVGFNEGPILLLFFGLTILIVIGIFKGLKAAFTLKDAGANLAAGDLSHQVDVEGMRFAFREHGENLNSIGQGMAVAVEERLKSERLKTELITNVSHDIKTPLTSIINYTDLIGKEDCDNEKIKEYVEVLLRQSNRLKKLIEDLIEASKASSGAMDVYLAPINPTVLMEQTIGENQDAIAAANLEIVLKRLEEGKTILADGRLLWRVFDNLINNICKYSQEGSRVYIAIEELNGYVNISFKNVSKAPLNVTPEELIERFIRGDESRTTEGNGLGLSIAESLTKLQGGALDLEIDGDLFKATIKFKS